MSEEKTCIFYFENLFKEDEPILKISTPENMLMEIKIRKASNRVVFNILKDGEHFNELSDVILLPGDNSFTFIDHGGVVVLSKIGNFEVTYVFPVKAEFKFYNFDVNKWREEDEDRL